MQTLTKTKHVLLGSVLSLGIAFSVQAAQDPNQYVQQIANQTLDAVKQNPGARSGNVGDINAIVNQYLMPHVNFERTTRLATGQPWRQASAEQKSALTNAFKGTLVRTYSGAFKNVNNSTTINMLPFRGDANANDVVVRSNIITASGPTSVDYRLEKVGDGWKVYDFSVEGIWLVQNYRNQFADQISRGGIDGLIKSLQR